MEFGMKDCLRLLSNLRTQVLLTESSTRVSKPKLLDSPSDW